MSDTAQLASYDGSTTSEDEPTIKDLVAAAARIGIEIPGKAMDDPLLIRAYLTLELKKKAIEVAAENTLTRVEKPNLPTPEPDDELCALRQRASQVRERTGKSINILKGATAEQEKTYLRSEITRIEAGTVGQVSCYPTDLCRVGPFFPIRRNNLSKRENILNQVITESSWGKISYSGPKLATGDLKVLIAVISIIDQQTGEYKSAFLPLLRALGYDRPGRADYKRVYDQLLLLYRANLEIQLGKDRKRTVKMERIVEKLSWKDEGEDRDLHILINSYFVSCFAGGTVTYIKPAKINRLRAVAALLYLFIMSQSESKWIGRTSILGAALNLSGLPGNQMRRAIKVAIEENVRYNNLQAKSKVYRDTTHLYRTSKSTQGETVISLN